MALEHLWAGWRGEYVATVDTSKSECVFCGILASGAPDDDTFILARGASVFSIMNLYPYTSGHLMVMPLRHVGELESLTDDEQAELWPAVTEAVRAVKAVYSPDGVNVGINLGRAAGAGVPGHLHVHVVPRWSADSNFMTAVAGTRVLPESLADSAAKLRKELTRG
ncbi:MAG TPA: HIT domain-containing protein [Acidimicrobiales bacterium]|nr:HIT domain-containing protein [Acidimicrobiales bacterium]